MQGTFRMVCAVCDSAARVCNRPIDHFCHWVWHIVVPIPLPSGHHDEHGSFSPHPVEPTIHDEGASHKLAPCLMTVDHMTNPSPFAPRGGTTPISILTFHIMNGMRLIDPIADLALGIRTLRSSQGTTVGLSATGSTFAATGTQGHCPWGSRSSCTAHVAIGCVVTTASVVDMLTMISLIHGTQLTSVASVTRQRVAEAVMLLCEAAIFVGAVLISQKDMLAEAGTAAASDMRSYTILCSISTFCALLTTALLLVVPEATWRSLESGKFTSRCWEVLAGLRARARRNTGTAAGRRTRGPSLFGHSAATVLPLSDTVSNGTRSAEMQVQLVSREGKPAVESGEGKAAVEGGAADV
eukprot:jgi/Ulvmu1/1136/UM107_0009.1